MRTIEQQDRYPNGITTEWEPYSEPGKNFEHWRDYEVKDYVKKLNKDAKEHGSVTRYRSVEIEDYSRENPRARVAQHKNPTSPALVEWVDVLSDIAHRENTPKFGRDKYYIGPLADIAAAQGMSRSVFEYKLIQANRAGLLRLSRADLTSAMPRDLVARSEIHYMNADFHFIEFQPYMENPIPTSALWLGAVALTAFGVYVIVKSVQNQQAATDSGGGYIYEPPITLNT